jgi:hypothetical protein
MNALAEDLAAQGEWQEMVDTRDELAQRAKDESRRDRRKYRFGVSVFDEKLRTAAPAKYAIQGIYGNPAEHHLVQIVATRPWSELNPVIENDALHLRIAYERVARGEDLESAGLSVPTGGLPLVLQPWEPHPYPDPADPRTELVLVLVLVLVLEDHDPLPAAGAPEPSDMVCDVLDRYSSGWLDGGSVRVRGSALEAISALGYQSAEVGEVSLDVALGLIARSIAFGSVSQDGGLLSRGRELGWGLLAALAGQPLAQASVEQLEAAGRRVRWYRYFAEREEWEWISQRQLAIEDPTTNVAWAMWAGDSD